MKWHHRVSTIMFIPRTSTSQADSDTGSVCSAYQPHGSATYLTRPSSDFFRPFRGGNLPPPP